jgi:hypothetical protein
MSFSSSLLQVRSIRHTCETRLDLPSGGTTDVGSEHLWRDNDLGPGLLHGPGPLMRPGSCHALMSMSRYYI